MLTTSKLALNLLDCCSILRFPLYFNARAPTDRLPLARGLDDVRSVPPPDVGYALGERFPAVPVSDARILAPVVAGLRYGIEFKPFIDNGSAPADNVLKVPAFRCCFCGKVKTFKTITGYWTHTRDKHGLIDIKDCVRETVRAGTI